MNLLILALLMFSLDGLFSMVVFLILLVLFVLAVILKICGLLLLGWPIILAVLVAAILFLILGANGVG